MMNQSLLIHSFGSIIRPYDSSVNEYSRTIGTAAKKPPPSKKQITSSVCSRNESKDSPSLHATPASECVVDCRIRYLIGRLY